MTRLITLIENNEKERKEMALKTHTGKAHIVGITGAQERKEHTH